MALPTPKLDDRDFQSLVDEAKRYIQRRCPDWTDHNVSDPGVAIIEAFAWMVDGLIYRLNRVTDRMHIRLLEMLGLTLRPPHASHVEVDLHLSAPPSEPILIPQGFQISTSRTIGDEPVLFSTVEQCVVRPASVTTVRAIHADGKVAALDNELRLARPVPLFDTTPVIGDGLYVGFDTALDRHIVLFTFVCTETGQGVGIDINRPPLKWQASTLSNDGQVVWADCEVGHDTTSGFNTDGVVLLHIPRRHASTTVDKVSAWWLRCVVVAPEVEGRGYRKSPQISALTGETIGASVDAMQGEVLRGSSLGVSDGTAGQEFALEAAPIAQGMPFEIATGIEQPDGSMEWAQWSVVANFGDSAASDRHVWIDASDGTIRFGPMIREEDGSVRQYGAIPPKGATVRIGDSLIGGGAIGNVRPHTITAMTQSFPQLDHVDNRHPATGGRDGDRLEDLIARAPLLMRSRGRAVTAEDFELLTLEAASELARAQCVRAPDNADGLTVRLCTVPAATPDELGQLQFSDLAVPMSVLDKVREYLDTRRVVGTEVVLEDTGYVGVAVQSNIRIRRGFDREDVVRRVTRKLNDYLSPLIGGPDATGWPFERPLRSQELHGVIQVVQGVDLVDSVTVRLGDPRSGELQQPRDEVRLRPGALFLPFNHQVTVGV